MVEIFVYSAVLYCYFLYTNVWISNWVTLQRNYSTTRHVVSQTHDPSSSSLSLTQLLPSALASSSPASLTTSLPFLAPTPYGPAHRLSDSRSFGGAPTTLPPPTARSNHHHPSTFPLP
jgi:hypothetical protein